MPLPQLQQQQQEQQQQSFRVTDSLGCTAVLKLWCYYVQQLPQQQWRRPAGQYQMLLLRVPAC